MTGRIWTICGCYYAYNHCEDELSVVVDVVRPYAVELTTKNGADDVKSPTKHTTADGPDGASRTAHQGPRHPAMQCSG